MAKFMQAEWQPIDGAPFNVEKPILVWLPAAKIVVSALPWNVLYKADGNTLDGWDGPPIWASVDHNGCDISYMPLSEQPTHWAWAPNGPRFERGISG